MVCYADIISLAAFEVRIFQFEINFRKFKFEFSDFDYGREICPCGALCRATWIGNWVFEEKKKKKKGKKWERRVRSVVCDGKLELFFTSKLVKMVFRLEFTSLLE